jgi:hypothetical protein
MDREVKNSYRQCLAEVGGHPRAVGQDRPSRLGPRGEGRSDSGVLHLHPGGQARSPEGGRRREDEPPKGVRVRANTGRPRAPGRREHQASHAAADDVPVACLEVRRLRQQAGELAATAAARTGQAAAKLVAGGLSVRDAAALLGVSPQRVSQLTAKAS